MNEDAGEKWSTTATIIATLILGTFVIISVYFLRKRIVKPEGTLPYVVFFLD